MNIPAVLAAVSAVVVLMVVAACLSPILRGLCIRPTEVLREG